MVELVVLVVLVTRVHVRMAIRGPLVKRLLMDVYLPILVPMVDPALLLLLLRSTLVLV